MSSESSSPSSQSAASPRRMKSNQIAPSPTILVTPAEGGKGGDRNKSPESNEANYGWPHKEKEAANGHPPSSKSYDSQWRKLVKQLESESPITSQFDTILAGLLVLARAQPQVMRSKPFALLTTLLHLAATDEVVVELAPLSLLCLCELLLLTALSSHGGGVLLLRCDSQQEQLDVIAKLGRRLDSPYVQLGALRQRAIYAVTNCEAIIRLQRNDAPGPDYPTHALHIVQSVAATFGVGESQVGALASAAADALKAALTMRWTKHWFDVVWRLWCETNAARCMQFPPGGSVVVIADFRARIVHVQTEYGSCLALRELDQCFDGWQGPVSYLELHHRLLQLLYGENRILGRLSEEEKDKLADDLLYGSIHENTKKRRAGIFSGIDFKHMCVRGDFRVREKAVSVALEILAQAQTTVAPLPIEGSDTLIAWSSRPHAVRAVVCFGSVVLVAMRKLLLERRLNERHPEVLTTLNGAATLTFAQRAYETAFRENERSIRTMLREEQEELRTMQIKLQQNGPEPTDDNRSQVLSDLQRNLFERKDCAAHWIKQLLSIGQDIGTQKHQVDELLQIVHASEQMIEELTKQVRAQLNRIEDALQQVLRTQKEMQHQLDLLVVRDLRRLCHVGSKQPLFLERPTAMAQLRRGLATGPSYLTAITGVPGSGKSQLAKHYVELELKEWDAEPSSESQRTLAWWFDCDEKSKLQASFRELLAHFGLSWIVDRGEALVGREKPSVRLMYQLQDKLQEFSHIILVFDNVLHFDDIAPYLLTRSGLIERTRTVITCWSDRLFAGLSNGPELPTVSLNAGLELLQAIDLLLRVSRLPPPDAGSSAERNMRKLIKQVDSLPLAIFNAGEVLREKQTPTATELAAGFPINYRTSVSSATRPTTPPRSVNVLALPPTRRYSIDADVGSNSPDTSPHTSRPASAGSTNANDPFAGFLRHLKSVNTAKLHLSFVDPGGQTEKCRNQAAAIQLALDRIRSEEPLFHKLLEFCALIDSQGIPWSLLFELYKQAVIRADQRFGTRLHQLAAHAEHVADSACCCFSKKNDASKRASEVKQLSSSAEAMVRSFNQLMLESDRTASLVGYDVAARTFSLHRSVQLRLRVLSLQHTEAWRSKRLDRVLDALMVVFPILHRDSSLERFELSSTALAGNRIRLSGVAQTTGPDMELSELLALTPILPHLVVVSDLRIVNVVPSSSSLTKILAILFRLMAYHRERGEMRAFLFFADRAHSMFTAKDRHTAGLLQLQQADEWKLSCLLRRLEAKSVTYQESEALREATDKLLPAVDGYIRRFAEFAVEDRLSRMPTHHTLTEEWALHVKVRGLLVRGSSAHRIGDQASALSNVNDAVIWSQMLPSSALRSFAYADAVALRVHILYALGDGRLLDAIEDGTRVVELMSKQEKNLQSGRLIPVLATMSKLLIRQAALDKNRSDALLTQAETHITRAQQLSEVFGSQSVASASALDAKAALYRARGQLSESATCYLSCCHIRASRLGSDADTADSYTQLGDVAMRLKHYQRAANCALRARKIYSATFGAEAPKDPRFLAAQDLLIKARKQQETQQEQALSGNEVQRVGCWIVAGEPL